MWSCRTAEDLPAGTGALAKKPLQINDLRRFLNRAY
jgi:hypothetical protein